MTPEKILQVARSRVARCWSQGAMYRDYDGHICSRDEAHCYSILGALLSQNKDESCLEAIAEAQQILMRAAGGQSVEDFNNAYGRTKDEIVKLFDKSLSKGK